MDSERIKDLLEKQKIGKLTDEEQMQLETWYIRLSQNEKADIDQEDITRRLDLVWNSLEINTKSSHKARSTKLIRISSVAAAVLALVVIGVYLFTSSTGNNPSMITSSANDIEPGKFGATLTLANGKKLRLKDAIKGELAKEAGIIITKSAEGSLIYELKGSSSASNKTNTLSTARGETYQLRLPDGTSVWLNSASSLTYHSSLYKNGLRRVKLEGEAYFEVFKDEEHPFIVNSAGQEVRVLGTHFNINSYTDEPLVKTTLLEGAVKVTGTGGAYQTIKPGEESLLSGGILKVLPANVEEAMAWKNGYFRFNDENIKSVMRKISRWYDVEVYFDNPGSSLALNGTIGRSKKLSQVLAVLESTQAVHFKIEGRRITVMP